MDPASPVIVSKKYLKEHKIAENQEEYRTLPAIILKDGTVISRWTLSWKERVKILLSGSMWISVLTFGFKLQPLLPQVDEPENILPEDVR